ncbi:MAG: sugar phosphate nucleotidyltransferase, partial [Ilumatobacteraceae bacterium]
MAIRTAVIPAAGLGTRFLPATKSVPKELMPIFDTPALQYVMDEAIGAGIEHLVIVSNVAKPGLEQYLVPSADVVRRVAASGRE